VCPWLTVGSASTALGESSTVEVKVLPTGVGSCIFRSGQGSDVRQLEIEVAASGDESCPAGSEKLKGIGNEAVVCRMQEHGEWVDGVTGRVRGMHFSVKLAGGAGDGAHRREAVEQAAEQVAGSLY
jgi:hypothetical protein